MNCFLKKPIVLTTLVLLVLLESNTLAGAQELFREPPEMDGFVPQAAPETRLRPIVPRGEYLPNSLPLDGSIPAATPGAGLQGTYRAPVTVLEYYSGQENGLSGNDKTLPVVPGQTDLRSIIEGTFEGTSTANDGVPNKNDGPEVITQRYPDGKPQLIKEVAQDVEGNYYNHGHWKLLNRRGQTLAEGQFNNGVMDGLWRRWHPQGAGGIFSTRPFNMFKGPFLSTATFSGGELDGIWTMYDNFERKIFEIPYRNGNRHGTASWWFPNSMKMREVTFNETLIDGPLREWDEQNKPVRYDEFIEGKKIVRETNFYRPKKKLDENYYLEAKLELSGNDDWWQAQPAGFEMTGTRVQHGPALAWHDNDQQKMKGQYRNDVRVGRFTWWHLNGQKALQGDYDEKGNKIGDWTWWHPNGIKSIQGQYNDDIPSGFWTWWEPSGHVSSKEDMDERAAVLTEPDDPSATDSISDETNNDGSILSAPDEFEALEAIEPFGEGSLDVLPDNVDSNRAQDDESKANEPKTDTPGNGEKSEDNTQEIDDGVDTF